MGQPGPRHVILLGFMGSGKTTVRKADRRADGPSLRRYRPLRKARGHDDSGIFDRAGETFRSYETGPCATPWTGRRRSSRRGAASSRARRTGR